MPLSADTQLTPHFTLIEMCVSQTAARMGIDNTPGPDVIEELKRTCELLEQIRTFLFSPPIIVTSGYRSPALNAAVGGVPNSAHQFGRAADIIVPSAGVPFIVANKLAASDLVFDQLIYEFESWVHVGIAPADQVPRRQVLTIDRNGTREGLS